MVRVLVDEGAWTDAPGADLERAAVAACRSLDVEDGEISVALLDDPAIAELNRTHLGEDHPTDVIAFALQDPGEPVLGDVYVGAEQAARQAADAGVSLREELIRLVVHGTLHVLGLDHPEEADARGGSPMYRRQESLVREVLGGDSGAP